MLGTLLPTPPQEFRTGWEIKTRYSTYLCLQTQSLGCGSGRGKGKNRVMKSNPSRGFSSCPFPILCLASSLPSPVCTHTGLPSSEPLFITQSQFHKPQKGSMWRKAKFRLCAGNYDTERIPLVQMEDTCTVAAIVGPVRVGGHAAYTSK